MKQERNLRVYMFTIFPDSSPIDPKVVISTVSAYSGEDAAFSLADTFAGVKYGANLVGIHDAADFIEKLGMAAPVERKPEAMPEKSVFDTKIEYLVEYLKTKGYRVEKAKSSKK